MERTRQHIIFEQVAQRFYRYLQELVRKHTDRPLDHHHAERWRKMCKYAMEVEGKRRGVAAFGPVGSGKTVSMRAFMATINWRLKMILDVYEYPPAIIISARDLNDIFGTTSKEDEYSAWLSRYKHVCVDDVATEDPYNSYEKQYHFGKLVLALYDMAEPPVLHITTNVPNPAALASIYGERPVDRLNELVSAMRFETPKSYRNED